MGGHRDHRITRAVRGWLDSPAVSAVAENSLFVSGWAFATKSRIVDVWITGLSGGHRPLAYGNRRDDVALAYPEEPQAAHSGFSGYVEFEHAGGPVRFEVCASLDDGRTMTLFKRRLPVADLPQKTTFVRRAVRQLKAQPQIVFSGRAWLNAFRLLNESSSNSSGQSGASEHLPRFLDSGTSLTLPASASPDVSIIVVVWNQAELTLACLQALAEAMEVAFEVIVVDNASTDDTRRLLDRVAGATVVTNPTNLGFTVAANAGARASRGEFLLFLNNDAVLERGSLERLLAAARRSQTIGAVGGKLVHPDGRLQEAGSIIWADGSCEGYGRGGDPGAPEYSFERPVDFCSGALLLTRRDTFNSLGGFDERYRPAYYEDADYCVRLWKSGLSVVYDPRAVAIHHEFGSAPSADASIELQRERRAIFAARHSEWLSAQCSRADGLLAARSHPHKQRSVLFIDDAVPDPANGAGFPRSAALLEGLAAGDARVTMYVTNGDGQRRALDRFSSVEVFGEGPQGLRAFLASRRCWDAVIVSRPHNMQYVKAAAGSDLSLLGGPCIYDAEALYALREIGRRELAGEPMTQGECRRLIDAELCLTRGCQAVLTVSERERELFEGPAANISVVAHAVEPTPTARTFNDRRSILFVGAFGPDSPNEDAALFFCREVLPALHQLRQLDVPIVIAGARIPDHVKVAAAAQSVKCCSDVADLTPFYDDARVFVAPTRYAAGIPLKVVEAAAQGVPVVTTPLVAMQLGWQGGSELLTGAGPAELAEAIARLWIDEKLWESIRASALQRVIAEYSPATFRAALHRAIDAATRR
ncbi:MAG TPA: glycosyltransferase [Vicinamibacterales bacterium]